MVYLECINCGKENGPNAKRCGECGSSVRLKEKKEKITKKYFVDKIKNVDFIVETTKEKKPFVSTHSLRKKYIIGQIKSVKKMEAFDYSFLWNFSNSDLQRILSLLQNVCSN